MHRPISSCRQKKVPVTFFVDKWISIYCGPIGLLEKIFVDFLFDSYSTTATVRRILATPDSGDLRFKILRFEADKKIYGIILILNYEIFTKSIITAKIYVFDIVCQ